jgi:glycosyltransferase involved in cell wall biosynthesis
MILYGTHGWIHLSIGRADRWFRWAMIEFFVTCLLFLAGLRWGPVGIASAWSISFWLLTLPAISYAGKPIGLEISSVLSAIWRSVAASVATVCVIFLIMSQIPSLTGIKGISGALLRIAIVSTMAALLYIGSVVVLSGGFSPVYQVARLLREMIRSDKQSEAPPNVRPDTTAALAEVNEAQAISGDLPLVSILIPAYNVQGWIGETIRSAMAQTWPRTEIIVVDDGSTDETLAVARQFESQGVRVVTQKNQGASIARNKAFLLCKGDYIQWLDADDLLASNKIARQMELVKQGVSKRTLLSGPWAHFMYRSYRARFIATELWCDLSPVEWLLRKMEQNIYMQTATWLVSRELTEAAGPWDNRLLGDDDGEYFCRVLLASEGVRFVSDARIYYRAFHFDGLSYIGRFPDKIEAHWLSMQLHIRYLRSLEDSERVRRACVEYLRDSLIYFYPDEKRIVTHARQLAAELGYELGVPHLSWKYYWIEALFGWRWAKPAQQGLRRFRWRLERGLDKALFFIDSRNPDAARGRGLRITEQEQRWQAR